ncbi:hypothetical protein NE237_022879 [Protea cynaroides]|uniref:Disease resistance protein RGA3 n=1 Tax=Protea cynaroides TaxID=273540 RepID=A0A9Q0HBT8_9MAGN|nr:hypothetical protein NE237_022879 [Protea cynaroides]
MVDAVGVVLENINSLLQKEFALVWGVDGEMKRLSSALLTIRDVLEDAEVKQFKDKAIRGWLKKLKDAAYDADDILDECAVKALQLEAQGRNCTNQVSTSFLSWFNFEQLMFRHKIGQKIKDVRKRFDDIAAERSNFHLNRGIVEWTVESNTERETTSILTEPQVYGRDEDREEIVKLLLNNISNPNLLVYPIIGMGGLGKTTLAQLVYNDERVKNHFNVRIWVCISDDFNVKRLIRAIIESMSGVACDLTDLDPMQSRLREMLGRRRFLLVLDDVWNEDQDKWDKLKYSLTSGIQGCSIIATTRTEKVGSIMGTFPAHHLKGLSEEDCWALFKQRAFGVGREENASLVVIGKEIVNKCGGVPLAAKALGSLMCFKQTETEWLFVRNSEIWDLPEDEENTILPALRLSYSHLPLHLRQCFAYCSIFPKDYKIVKGQLVHLWMANGFIPSKRNMELEDIGTEIFHELMRRSFFQVAGEFYGKVYKMHDLIHDLACSVMDNECLSLVSSMEKIVPERIRHLSLESYTLSSGLQLLIHSSINESLHKSQNIRTLLLNSLRAESDIVYQHFNFSKFGCLRALELNFHSVGSSCSPSLVLVRFINELGNLIHLRYLKLSYINVRALPESLSNLKHLQTLILRVCPMLEKLPAQMSSMSSLMHLNIDNCYRLSHMPIGIGRLRHLQTLSIFIVGMKSGCRISELQGLNLKGQLHIKGLEKVKNSMDAKEANLIRMINLESLTLSWSSNTKTHIQENAGEVLEGLQPPASIQILRIENYHGMKFPCWMEDLRLQNLVRVELIDCKRCEHLPPLGHLPLLKHLSVSRMDSIRYLSEEFYSGDDLGRGIFPSLKNLKLEEMINLEELLLNVPQGRQVFRCLVSINIINCDKLANLPFLPSLQRVLLRTKNENVPEGLLQNRNLPVLQELEFNGCPKLITLLRLFIKNEELDFSSLEVIRVSNCNAMEYLWEDETQFQGLISLKRLDIQFCSKLASLSGIRYLSALEDLNINQCPELELSQLEDFQHLTSLRVLSICSLPQLMSLPQNLKHTTLLQYLLILDCDGLTTLAPEWIHNLTSLRTLQISYCRNLTFLPDGIRQLTALQTLTIEACPILETRCRDGGEDWPKIAHIPNVIVKSWNPPMYMNQNSGCWGSLLELRRRLIQ